MIVIKRICLRIFDKKYSKEPFFYLQKNEYKFFSEVNMGCGSTVAQNISYHSISSFNSANHANPCKYTICPCGSNICKLRLDFQVKHVYFKRLYTQLISTYRMVCLIPNGTLYSHVYIHVVSLKIDSFSIAVSLSNNRGNCQNSTVSNLEKRRYFPHY